MLLFSIVVLPFDVLHAHVNWEFRHLTDFGEVPLFVQGIKRSPGPEPDRWIRREGPVGGGCGVCSLPVHPLPSRMLVMSCGGGDITQRY